MSTTIKHPVCKDSLKVLGDYWTMMIIDRLVGGPLRFRDLERQIDGVNTATLASRLKAMQSSGLISRTEQSRSEVTYQLTELGEQAIPILHAVNHFSNYAKQQSGD